MILTLLTGWKLASVAYPNTKKSYILKQQFKIILLVLIHPRFAKQWFSRIKSPELSQIYPNRPGLHIKPLRVYMSTQWDIYRKAKVILDTYDLLRKHPNKLFENILTNDSSELLARFSLKNDSFATVTAGYDTRFRKEGEIVIALECEELGGLISSIAFSFEEVNKDCFVCRIGCVQGNKSEKVNLSKEMQKLLYGQRPSSLMLFLVQEFIKHLNVSVLYGASDSIQANLQKHAIHINKFHNITFSYDKLWAESQGELQEEGWFKLPISSVKRQIENIKPKKRAMYRKRYALQDSIADQFKQNLS